MRMTCFYTIFRLTKQFFYFYFVWIVWIIKYELISRHVKLARKKKICSYSKINLVRSMLAADGNFKNISVLVYTSYHQIPGKYRSKTLINKKNITKFNYKGKKHYYLEEYQSYVNDNSKLVTITDAFMISAIL